MCTISKVFIELVTMLLKKKFWFFGHNACEILAPWPGIKPTPPTLEGDVLTTGPPGKYQFWIFWSSNNNSSQN